MTFRATSIKLYLTLITQIEVTKVKLTSEETTGKELTSKELAPLLVKRNRGPLHKNLHITIFLQDDD
jgi:hypothetical protein